MTFVLIYWLMSNANALSTTGSIHFHTINACENARAQILKMAHGTPFAICVPNP